VCEPGVPRAHGATCPTPPTQISDGDDGDMFNAGPGFTTGTKNDTKERKADLDDATADATGVPDTRDAGDGESTADDDRTMPKETVPETIVPETVPENVPEKVVKAAMDAPDTLVDVAKASIAEDVASMKRAKDEAQRELDALRARLKALEASLAGTQLCRGTRLCPGMRWTRPNRPRRRLGRRSRRRPRPPRSPSRRWTED